MAVKILNDRLAEVLKNVKTLTAKEVKIGVPADKAERKAEEGEKGAPPNNAEIGMWMEFGVPEKNIPARPFLVPGVQSIKDKAIKRLKKAGELAIDGHLDGVAKQLASIGLEGAAAVQQKITDGPFAPLSERTIEARAARGRKGAKKYLKQSAAGQTPDAGLVKPLIDTGALRQSISFVVTDKGKDK